jgi:hypothetical protein
MKPFVDANPFLVAVFLHLARWSVMDASSNKDPAAEPSASPILEQMTGPKPAMAASATTVVEDKESKPQTRDLSIELLDGFDVLRV